MVQISLGEIKAEVLYKDIKNLHLSVYPPNGAVRISAPLRLDIDTIRAFAISKLEWIRKQQSILREQARETPRDFISRESHYYLGKLFLLKISELQATPSVILNHDTIGMHIRPGTPPEKRELILDEWYRKRLKEIVPRYIKQWEPKLNVKVNSFGIKKMKTKWGSCNHKAGRIWLNLELAKKPLPCIEYVVVHEMVHLIERKHSQAFTAHMDNYLPMWKSYKTELNRSPLSHQDWSY
jgi:predicted metal-dependent hydrolase